MIKKIIALLIILFLGMFLLGCGEETLPTTTTTTCVDTTTTTEATTTTTESTTTTTTTTTTLPIYDMSSVLYGTVLAMSQAQGYLYISTDQNLYKISMSDPTASSPTSVTVTHNIFTILAGRAVREPETIDLVIPLGETSTPNIVFIQMYTLDLVPMSNPSESTTSLQACCLIDNTDYALGYDNSYLAIFKVEIGSNAGPVATYNITETPIIGMDYENNKVFTCSTNTIYKYSYDGTTLSLLDTKSKSSINVISDLVGIAYDGSYVWLLDSNKKLYKYLDN